MSTTQMLELELSPLLIALAAVMITSALYLLLGFRRYIYSVRRRVAADSLQPLPESLSSYPPLSVIVYSEDDAANLEILLPQILEQDYPAPFEVIVVNDGQVDATKDVIARLEQRYSNLYMTFTPLESRALSRKKLALTLGIKAAKYGIVVNTSSCCQVPSPLWLRSIGSRFSSSTDIVFGYAAPCSMDDTPHPRARLHAFDQVRSSIEWLSWAIAGRPYRGTCHNIAYRRELFFRNKGFSRSLDLKWGDDDVFVSEVANRDNTVTQLSQSAMLLEVQSAPASAHRVEKLRRNYTASRLRHHARLFFSTYSWAWWILFGSALGLGVFGWPSIIPAAVGVVTLLTVWTIIMVSWKRTSIALWSRPLLFTVPWFMFIHPFHTLYYNFKGHGSRGANLTWE